ncbi:MAG: hypothetical protein GF393_07795 [Armatimonadia bacterium]|nr:hypothetical protein [Armatimonadia bacterium]
MGQYTCNRAWRTVVLLTVLLISSIIPAVAEMRVELYATNYSPANGRTTYSYELFVDESTDVQAPDAEVSITGMAGVLSQGDATFWQNAGITATSAHWTYSRQTPFTRHGTFDVIADPEQTEPGIVDYEVVGSKGKIGTVEGPVARTSSPSYGISGTVYLDNDNSGGLYDDAVDEVLTGIEVQLLDSEGVLVATTTTNLEIRDGSNLYIGNYRFGNLPAGDYEVVAPDPITATDPELYATTSVLRSVSIVDSSVREVDFGYSPELLYTISGTIFVDYDRDGAWDMASEDRLSHAGPLTLVSDEDGSTVSQTFPSFLPITGDGGVYLGNYMFTDVPAGSYTVVAPDTAGELGTLEITGPTNRSADVVDGNIMGIDFGYIDPSYTQPVDVEVQGYVFFDANKNGQLDDFEMRFDGITVTLSGDGSGSETTDSDGFVDFGAQGAGDYTMAVTDGGAYKLLTYWYSTTAVSQDFTIDTDTEGPVVRYFGFFPDVCEIIRGICAGDITGENHTIGFWKHNVTRAIMGFSHGVQVPADDLLGYLDAVEDLGPYDEPYDLGDDKLRKALWYLHPAFSGNCPVQKLDRQLLAAELNWVSGYSSSEPALEGAILWYAEWARNYNQAVAGNLAEFIDLWNNLGD